MVDEIATPLEYSREIVPKRSASVFDRLGPIRKRKSRPRILLAQIRPPLIPLSHPHLSNPSSLESQHGRSQPETVGELAHRYIHPPPRISRERRAALARM
ncbi:Hypothetical predicted protein [Olea europaea subsp. europaea]|uniref:Uncharacterized protein n=1 Tax=Olea europaea subsp. europaea TaxID=158383 RepID=A0A8S0R3N6_OLEEU|nr:Hypothetical predicted protein [Olea europaea subsp. europaea]